MACKGSGQGRLQVGVEGSWIRPDQQLRPRRGAWRPGSRSRRARPAGSALTLVATNGQVIATSEACESKASAINGIESVKRNAPTAAIDDQIDK
jgi:uncharacterized protein YegP (UPF0339 family)